MWKGILVLIMSFFIINTSLAAEPCVWLGSQPSLIIKLKNNDSNLAQTDSLSSSWLQHLSTVAQLTFTHSRPMAGSDYIIFFNPPMPHETCYSIAQLQTITQAIAADGAVEYVQPNIILRLAAQKISLPSIQLESIQWDMGTPNLGGINAQVAWNTTQANSHVVVGVLDTGIFNNTSLNPNVRSGATFNGNGYWTTGATPSCGINECDGSDHGTHTAGTIAASGIAAYEHTIFGVAPAANVLPINVFSKFTSEDDCGAGQAPCLGAYEADYINAIYWLSGTVILSSLGIPPSVVAINMSFGGGYPCSWSPALQEAFDTLIAHNITPVAAAGNSDDNAIYYSPASCNGVITVAATNEIKSKAYYSNWGNAVAIAAPGGDDGVDTEIYSTTKDGYAAYQGTSMAAPHIAGVVALLYAVDPTMTPARALQIMQNNVTPFASGSGSRSCAAPTTCGAGIVNAASAVVSATATAPQIEWTPNVQLTTLASTAVSINWSAATWNNAATTPIRYSVSVDGSAVAYCQTISITNCTVINLSSLKNGAHTFVITAGDYREIVTDNVSGSFITKLTAPVLNYAVRNPANTHQVWMYYQSLGTDEENNSYTVNNMPPGITVSVDKANQRFILDNVNDEKFSNVSIMLHNTDLESVASNPVIIASAAFKVPTLQYISRNQTILTQAWIYYSDLGSDDVNNIYTLEGINSGVISLERANKRFVINNVVTPKASEVYMVVSNSELGTVQSMPIRFPSIVG